MTKKINIDPKQFLNPKNFTAPEIKKMNYNKSISNELDEGNLEKKDIKDIFFQMTLIREFENLLSSLKTKGEYANVKFNYTGPAHLEIGEEAAIVGANYILDKEDVIFGTHRNHGEVISKSVSAIRKMNDSELEEILLNYNNGKIFNAINSDERFKKLTWEEKAINYIVYGFLAEIFSRETGVNGGIGGTMHMFFPPFGIYPNNGIVGGSFPMGLGAALYKLVNNKNGIAASFVGDGGISAGPIWETLCMSSMDQYVNLWPQKKFPPFMVNVINNSYAISAQTMGETMGNNGPAITGLGINERGMHSEVVDGQNPLAVIDLIRRKKKILVDGNGPVLNEIRTYRFDSHSSHNFQDSYRTEEEINSWKKYDPIKLFKDKIINENIFSIEELSQIENESLEIVKSNFLLAMNEKISPFLGFEENNNYLDDFIFSNKKRIKNGSKINFENNSRLNEISEFEVSELTYSDAIFKAIAENFEEDEDFIIFSQDSRFRGGLGGVYNGISETIDFDRLFNTPINESGMLGSAIGYSMMGGQVLVQITYMDFLFRAGDEIASQLSKWRSMSGGSLTLPVILRTGINHGWGVQHSQDYTNILSSITGIKIAAPITPKEAYQTFKQAFSTEDPIIIIEDGILHRSKNKYTSSLDNTTSLNIDNYKPSLIEEGKDVTIVTLGIQLETALVVREQLAKENIDVEILSINWIVPMNLEPIIESVNKTKKVLLINNGYERMNIMKEISQTITELLFDKLEKPPYILGAKNWVTPNGNYDKYIYPTIDQASDLIREKFFNLEVKNKRPSSSEIIDRKNKGI